MLRLKQVLQEGNLSQAELARHLQISRAAVAQLVNHHQYPRSMDQQELKQRIQQWLVAQGVTQHVASQAFEEEAGAAENSPNPQHTSVEDHLMLLRKQQLTLAARKAFALGRDPFADVREASEVFLTSDSRYVREALRQAARHGGFVAVVGESGAGKSTLRCDLIDWINRESQPVIVIEPYVLGMEENDQKGKTLKSAHIAEAILSAVAPGTAPKRSPEGRFNQMHSVLKESFRAGNRHLLVIEEAHGLPTTTLKHLKRFFELKDGFSQLLGVALIGQSELAQKLDERNAAVREVVQRCEVVNLRPLDNDLENYLQHRFRLAGKELAEVMDDKALMALRTKLTGPTFNVLYPLAVHNVLAAAMNMAADVGLPRITAEFVEGV